MEPDCLNTESETSETESEYKTTSQGRCRCRVHDHHHITHRDRHRGIICLYTNDLCAHIHTGRWSLLANG